jgi:hypothetical protein
MSQPNGKLAFRNAPGWVGIQGFEREFGNVLRRKASETHAVKAYQNDVGIDAVVSSRLLYQRVLFSIVLRLRILTQLYSENQMLI